MPRGETKHLDGKRSGRPPGTGRRSTVLADMRWAFKTYMDPDARPPTHTAKAFKLLAQQNLLAFAEVLGRLEAGLNAESPAQTPKSQPPKHQKPADDSKSGQSGEEALSGPVKIVRIYERDLLDSIRGNRPRWMANLPSDASVIEFGVSASGQQIELTLRSNAFGMVAPGEPVPGIEMVYVGNYA